MEYIKQQGIFDNFILFRVIYARYEFLSSAKLMFWQTKNRIFIEILILQKCRVKQEGKFSKSIHSY